MTRSLHVCYGLSAAGSLFAEGFKPTLAFGHTFEGRIQDFKTYEEYETNSQKIFKKYANTLRVLMKSKFGKHLYFTIEKIATRLLYLSQATLFKRL